MNQKYVMNMMEIASDFDAISTELFALSHNAADNPQYDPKTKLYSLVRSTEENAVQLRHLAGRVLGKSSEPIYDTVVSAMGIGVVEEENGSKSLFQPYFHPGTSGIIWPILPDHSVTA